MADDRLDAAWHVEECSDEHMDNCPCIIATGDGDRIQYVADAETPELAARIVADHNEAAALRKQLETVNDEMTGLRLHLDKYVGKEPTLRDEMAYLSRCLDAVYGLCREVDDDGNTSDGKFTPAAVIQAASGEREDNPNDRRRRLYLDGHGQAWVETGEGFITEIGLSLWDGEPIGNIRERTGEIHEIGRTW
ncbi:hypothetical protein [Streptomyces virginiae]|uniref:hypothetical protein n=1 Tax=Streptomyces virginiae TaxID=1961 RepID=UPI0037BDAC71